MTTIRLNLEPMYNESRWFCASNLNHRLRETSDSRNIEHVIWTGDAQHIATCSCESFKFREVYDWTCKHIDRVREKLCLWHGARPNESVFASLGDETQKEYTCPGCGGPVIEGARRRD